MGKLFSVSPFDFPAGRVTMCLVGVRSPGTSGQRGTNGQSQGAQRNKGREAAKKLIPVAVRFTLLYARLELRTPCLIQPNRAAGFEAQGPTNTTRRVP